MFARNRRLRRSQLRSDWLYAGAWAFAILLTQAANPVTAADPLQPTGSADPFAAKVAPFAAKYCVDCHSGDEAEAGIKLASYSDMAAFLKSRKVWRLAGQKIAAGEMPPADHEPRPQPDEAQAIANWIDQELTKSLLTSPIDPGRVTVRRLNRAEYNNTIRDLVGIDFKPAADFPQDDVGYGFDNIGDVLGMPSILLEKYLAAAETIVERAIMVDHPDKAPARRILGARLDGAGSPAEEDVRVLTSEGEAFTSVEIPSDGEYLLTVQASADQAGREVAKMAIKLDEMEFRQFEVANLRHNAIGYKAKFRAERGNKRVGVAFTNDYFKNKDQVERGEKPGDRNLYIEYVEVQGPLGLDPEKLSESHKKIIICEPPSDRPIVIRPRRARPRTPEEREAAQKAREKARREREKHDQDRRLTRADCARTIIEQFATRAFRRPVASDEVDRLMKLWQMADKEGQPFERGIQLAVTAVLVSPHFLYRVEGEPAADDPDNIYELNDVELATRLSYFLWSTMPDEVLSDLARRGELRKNGNLEQQVRRMLADPKSQALVENFAGQWLQTRRLASVNIDRHRFPAFDDALRSAMEQETALFFAAIMRQDRSVLEFLDADFTFLNERLAKHYGIPGVDGDNFRQVTLASDQIGAARRGGILTMASVLTITSNPTRTSPVKRGKYVLENILGTPPPPPPPEVPELEEGAELKGSLKERMVQHRENASCASCHQRMDPIGFGMEHFDAIGAWREKDGPHTIDASGELVGGKKFSGSNELKEVLKSQRELFVRCLVDRLLTYALGRGLEDYDEATIERIAQAVAKKDYRFTGLVLQIVQSDAFQKKRGVPRP